MIWRMAENKPALRLTESMPGRLAGWLLAVLWIFSMSGVDAHAFSAFPAFVVLAVVLVLVSGAVLAGKRLVQMSRTGWFALAVGSFFLLRCLNSYAVVDSWCESALILAALVYYIAGVYVAQNKNYGKVMVWLAAALVLNAIAMWASHQPWFCLEWTGRAEHTPQGSNLLPASLFVYKNFAGVFFALGGSALCVWSLCGRRGWQLWGGLSIGAVAVGLSFFCSTRAIMLVLPLSIFVVWGLKLLINIFHDRKLGFLNVLLGVAFVVCCLVVVFDLLFGHVLMARIAGADSHLRYLIWGAVCEVLPSVPWWGCGANATTWELVPYYHEWQLPNYAHNEYLQTWVDYGLLGVILLVCLVVVHLLRGLCCLASELVSEERSHLVLVCMLVVAVMAAYAFVDFPGHSFAFVCWVAFACGVLASPFAHREASGFSSRKWVDSSRSPQVPVRAQAWPGKIILLAFGVGLAAVSGWMSAKLLPAWSAQWQYNELSKNGRDADALVRRKMIAQLLPLYPSPALLDTYFMFPQNQTSLAEQERLLKLALNANPKQLFTVAMLVGVLGKQGKFAEAERLMREKYVGDAMPRSVLNNWPGYYAYNLLLWGRHEMQQGRHAVALSMLDYALSMHAVHRISFEPVWRAGAQPWKEYGGIKPGLRQLIEACMTDLRLLRLMGVQPDDSWQQPMSPGGRPALYRSFVKKKG